MTYNAVESRAKMDIRFCVSTNARHLRGKIGLKQRDESEAMANDTRNLPASRDGLHRFLGGTPLAVAFRLILLSILVGIVLAAIGFDPWNIVQSVRQMFRWLWNLGFDSISWLWRYFLLGAVIVIPVWLLSRIFNAPRGR